MKGAYPDPARREMSEAGRQGGRGHPEDPDEADDHDARRVEGERHEAESDEDQVEDVPPGWQIEQLAYGACRTCNSFYASQHDFHMGAR